MLRDDSFGLSTREAYLPSTTGAKPWVLGCRSSGILPENGRNLFNLTEPEYDSRVPAGEVPADLPGGPAPVIREASLQARRHFTLADQVNQLVAASEADPETGFISRMLALVFSVPHQPRQPDSVQAAQRPLHALHDRGR